jgi:Uri superfamily endonuclease
MAASGAGATQQVEYLPGTSNVSRGFRLRKGTTPNSVTCVRARTRVLWSDPGPLAEDRREPASPRCSCAAIVMSSPPGTYALVLNAPRPARAHVGKLGRLGVQPGFYVYVGSALGPGGVVARVRRHARRPAKPHWHVDHLRPHTRLVEVWTTHALERLEHHWARAFLRMRDARIPLRGFGASDCRCASHLFFFATRPTLARFRRTLRAETPDPPKLRVWIPESGRSAPAGAAELHTNVRRPGQESAAAPRRG